MKWTWMGGLVLVAWGVGVWGCGGVNVEGGSPTPDPSGDDDDDDDQNGQGGDTETAPAGDATSLAVGNDKGDTSIRLESGRTQLEATWSFVGGTQTDWDQITVDVATVAGTAAVSVNVPSGSPTSVLLEVKAPMTEYSSIGVTDGDIELEIPASTKASLVAAATTSSGFGTVTVSSNLNFAGTNGSGAAYGTINGGGPTTLTLGAENGNIDISGY